MIKQIEFRDDHFPAGKRDLFLAVLMGLYALKFAGWSSMLVLSLNGLGVTCLFVAWILAFNAKKMTLALFLKIWWAGLLLILLGQTAPFFIVPVDVVS